MTAIIRLFEAHPELSIFVAVVFGTIAAAGAVVTLAPQLVGFWFGSRVLKMPVAILLGGLAGAQTATPARNALKDAAATTCSCWAMRSPTRSTACC